MTEKVEALRLAEWLEKWAQDYAGTQLEDMALTDAAAELRRLHAENERLHQINQSHELKLSVRGYEIQIEDLRQANEAFGKRQEWWNARMFELEKQRDELLEQLSKIVEMIDPGGHDVVRRVRRRHAAIAKVEGEKK